MEKLFLGFTAVLFVFLEHFGQFSGQKNQTQYGKSINLRGLRQILFSAQFNAEHTEDAFSGVFAGAQYRSDC
jgi:hypothetical protein